MVEASREDWILDVGLVDDFDGEIVDAYFSQPRREYVEASGSSAPMLFLVFDSPQVEQRITQGYSCGGAKEWEITDDGKGVASRRTPESRKFNVGSKIGLLIDKMLTCINPDREKAVDFIRTRGYMTQAETFIGLSFHWCRERTKIVSGEERETLLPTEFLGEKETEVQEPEPQDETLRQIIEMSKGKTERELKRALLTSSLKNNPKLMNEIVNKNFLGKLEEEGKLLKSPEGKYV